MSSYLAEPPSGAGPWPGVVVVHESLGLNDDIKAWADRIAAEGYVALAPDLFEGSVRPVCLVATFRALISGRGPAVDRVEAARAELAGRDDGTGKVGIVGFCMGGGFALLMAARGFDAAAPNYGHPPKKPDEALRGACPIVASYGGKDRSLRGAARKLEAVLERQGVTHDVKEYPNASHSFLNRHAGPVWGVIDRVAGIGWHGPSADDAWERIRSHLAVHLAG